MTVALVDDHQALRRGTELLLEHEGCRVVGSAGDAAAGFELIRRCRPEVSVIDMALAGDSGVELTRRLLAHDPGSPSAQRRLSLCEADVLALLAEGLTGEQIAERLVLSPETVRTHLRNAMGKLNARTRVHAIAMALRDGELTL